VNSIKQQCPSPSSIHLHLYSLNENIKLGYFALLSHVIFFYVTATIDIISVRPVDQKQPPSALNPVPTVSKCMTNKRQEFSDGAIVMM